MGAVVIPNGIRWLTEKLTAFDGAILDLATSHLEGLIMSGYSVSAAPLVLRARIIFHSKISSSVDCRFLSAVAMFGSLFLDVLLFIAIALFDFAS